MDELSTTLPPNATPSAAPPPQPDLEPEDEVTAYAAAVLAGEIVAGPLVRLACERHQRDLTSGEERGLVFDVHAAQRAIGFFRDVLNQEALLFEITNSGFDKKTVCGQEHDMSVRILKREFENDAWFAFIANLDEADDPFEDETCWPKANPNLGVSIQPGFIREQVQEARGMPSKEGLVRRLHFCQWTESATSAIPRKVWEDCEGEVDVDALTEKNVPCYGGLDLSRARDLTAFTLTWLLDATKDQWKFASRTWFWTPADTLKERAKTDRAPYELWVQKKFMEAVQGPRIKYSWVADALLKLVAQYHPVMIGADQYGLEQLLDALGEKGGSIPAEVHPQGFQRRIIGERDGNHNRETGADDIVWWMPDSINKLEAALLEKRITVAENPVMRMCAGGVVYEQNRTGHRMFAKDKATTRIDGMVSLAMSIGVATSMRDDSSIYSKRGALVL